VVDVAISKPDTSASPPVPIVSAGAPFGDHRAEPSMRTALPSSRAASAIGSGHTVTIPPSAHASMAAWSVAKPVPSVS
jgi:hypothetical protein